MLRSAARYGEHFTVKKLALDLGGAFDCKIIRLSHLITSDPLSGAIAEIIPVSFWSHHFDDCFFSFVAECLVDLFALRTAKVWICVHLRALVAQSLAKAINIGGYLGLESKLG
jgi:hypothetical protein